MFKKIQAFMFVFVLSIIFSCTKEDTTVVENSPDPDPTGANPIAMPDNPQNIGDATKGYEYLVTGDYMSSGIPYDIFLLGFGENKENILNRTGDNAVIPHDFNTVMAPNNVKVVAPNCLQCHAGKINGNYIIGLGNNDYDFTINRESQIPMLNLAITTIYGEGSEEWQAYDQFRKAITAIGPKTVTVTRGSNPADKITQVLAAYRDPNSLEWLNSPNINVTGEVIPTDVPAWWLVKKKNAIFYNGMGRKNFLRYMMGSSLLTVPGKVKMEEIDTHMKDILAYLYSIEPPKYPFDINSSLASAGETIFNNKCSSCHGTYGVNESYPNLLFPLELINTDSAMANFYTSDETFSNYFLNWFGSGWFSSGSNALEIVPEKGYIAPPLDGIWATAPYFHNGSVPTLEDVLNSSSRPVYWSRTFTSTDYNQQKVGWNYTVEYAKLNKNTYDTTLFAHGNGGHAFGDSLSAEDRKALLEYLKTL